LNRDLYFFKIFFFLSLLIIYLNSPDQFTDPNNDPSGREPETQAIMNFWKEQYYFHNHNQFKNN